MCVIRALVDQFSYQLSVIVQLSCEVWTLFSVANCVLDQDEKEFAE
jgi:hypothetical protein